MTYSKDGPVEVEFEMPKITIVNSRRIGKNIIISDRNIGATRGMDDRHIAALIAALLEAPTPESLGRRIMDQITLLGSKIRATVNRKARRRELENIFDRLGN